MDLGFVQSGMLYALLGLSIPYIVHLIFRKKPRNVDLGSIRFVRYVMESSRSRRKVLRWLLLALRMACIALLALLFARPFTVSKETSETDDHLVVLLVDRSASMQLQTDGRRLIDIAIERARRVINQAGPATRLEIAWFDQDVDPLTDNDSNRALEAPESMYGATNYSPALRWARDVCASSKSTRQDLHIFTDMQQFGLAWSDVDPMPPSVKVTVHDVGRDLPNNIAVTRAQPLRHHIRPGESTIVEVILSNDGPFTLDNVPATLLLNNGTHTIRMREKIKLEPGSMESVEFKLPEMAAGLWQGRVVLEIIDDAAFDNTRHIAIAALQQYPVLIVDGAPHEADFFCETYLLQAALRLTATGKTNAESAYRPQLGSLSTLTNEHAAVVLANVESVPKEDAVRLREYVHDGGGLIVFCGNNVSSKGCKELSEQGLVPGEIVSARESFHLPWRIEWWDKSHSIFEPFADPQHGDLRRLAFSGITDIVPARDAVTLATLNEGRPLVVERTIGDSNGTVVWVTTSCDHDWGSWAQSELFLPMVYQLLGYVSGLNAGGPVRYAEVGSTASATQPGVHRKARHWQVVNINSRESELERSRVGDFVDRFELNTSGREPSRDQLASVDADFSLGRNEIWHWLLCGLFVVGSLEYLVANRTVE